MDVKLDAEAMQALVVKAVFDGLTPEKRDALLQGAIAELMNRPSGSRSYNDPTNLQRIFNDAARTVAEKIAEEKLAQDPTFKANVEKMFADVSAKLFAGGEEDDKLTTTMAQTIRSALSRDRY